MTRTLFTIFATLVFGLSLWGQSPTVFNYGNKKAKDNLLGAASTRDGGILAVGQSESEYWDGWDGTLMKIDQEGKRIFRKALGSRLSDDAALSVVEDATGRVWVGGSSDSAGYHVAWLMCRNPAGEPIWQQHLAASTTPNAIFDLKIAPDGRTIGAAGVQNGQPCLWRFDLDGHKQSSTVFGNIGTKTDLKAEKVVLLATKSGWTLYGGTTKDLKGKQVPFFIQADPSGKATTSLLLNEYSVDMTGQFLQTNSGALLATGTTTVPLRETEAFTLYVPANLDKTAVTFQTFGGRNPNKRNSGSDEGADIIALDDKTCLVVGSTRSHRPGANWENMAAWRVDMRGQPLDTDMRDVGGDLQERAVRAVRMYSGAVWLCGVQNDGNGWKDDRNFAFVKLETLTLPYAAEPRPDQIRFNTLGTAPAIAPGSNGTVALEVINQANTPVEGMYITAECPASMPGCYAGLRYHLPPLAPGETYFAQLPIWSDKEAPPSESKLELKLNAANGRTVGQKSTTIAVGVAKKPNMQLVTATSAKSGKNAVVRGKGTPVEVKLTNTGAAEGLGILTTFMLPDGVRITGKNEFLTEKWPTGTQKSFLLNIFADPTHTASTVTLKAYISGNNLPEGSEQQTTLALVAEEALTEALPAAYDVRKAELEVRWDDDNQTLQRKTSQKEFYLDIEVSGNTEVAYQEVSLLFNGQKVGFDTRSDEFQIKKTNKNTRYFIYALTGKVNLAPGDNTLQVQVQKGNKTFESAPLQVNYQANDHTLHVVCIGVPDASGKLRWTRKDAMDIASMYRTQEGKIYGNVSINTLVTADSTRAEVISRTLRNFKLLEKRDQLHDGDAIVVYFSTHGFVSEEDGLFRLQGSNFDPGNERYTSLSFRDDVQGVLEPLSCHKVIFLDACHSGSVNEALTQGRKGGAEQASYVTALNNALGAARHLRALTSCGVGEYSYEDDVWKNGAFTKALRDLFTDKSTCTLLDKNQDRALSIGELYTHLQKTVNELVKKQRNATQTPFAPASTLKEDLPIWGY